MHTLTLLDCTLRDGGYYNDWKFKKPYVEKYIRDISNANIDVIEIGFHFFEKHVFVSNMLLTNHFLKNMFFNILQAHVCLKTQMRSRCSRLG